MTKTENDRTGEKESGVDRLREELSNFLAAQVENLAEKAGGKLTDVTGKLSDVADSGGSLPAIGSRVLQGESPMKAFVSEKAKGVKDNVVGKVKEAFGGGKGKRKSSGGKVMNIIEVLDVGVPLRDAYDFWTQYDQFSSFAKGVRDVSKSDEVGSDWKVKVGPSSRSFKATVQEQIPDDRIVWTSEGAKGTTRGVVSFHELAPTLTRIVLVVEYYPSGFFEKTGNLWRAQGRRMRLDFKNFQRYVTLTNEEPEGWRGEIRDGEVVVSHEDAMEEEEADQEESEGEEPEGEGGGDAGEGADSAYEDEDEDVYEDEDEDEEEAEGAYEDEAEEEDEDGVEDEDQSTSRQRRAQRRRRA
ncbi:SRPBCC family protein [Streptomyces europaeiscabiei]|uniref:SRPBCC family protein n=1 Tax=Streptomyces europaeiscabiei TaxID=146819 RepID=A0ABU4NCS9_9ACTN|nr:SRPBCC family protein [Streptomyces europaeiscabiei]MDX3549355.1 SRPBCC family protein [Streptomyces europaeiscabiei]MDX3552129.1 SRPBCC family protein [Streptomyces europaeiscabiei]MDX3665834.1 SRPBCC family protein [Streptomyces europaeiscabiei]MDX3700921.1 SRPBCC family protein [Streptomyces europaeiscabiei]MDX3714209.1 SRPBCC family protein [Streptomyces europaeiscabiei]